MEANSQFAVAELRRRMENMLLIGVIEKVKDAEAQVRSGEMISDWLPVLQRRAGKDSEKWDFEKGEQVLVVCPSGDIDNGVIVGAIHQKNVPDGKGKVTKFSDGSVLRHEVSDGHKISFDLKGKCQIEIKAENFSLFVGNDGVIKLKGKRIDVEGEVPASEQDGVLTGMCVCPLTGVPHAPASKVLRAALVP